MNLEVHSIGLKLVEFIRSKSNYRIDVVGASVLSDNTFSSLSGILSSAISVY